jgi:hypothetical protein
MNNKKSAQDMLELEFEVGTGIELSYFWMQQEVFISDWTNEWICVSYVARKYG